MSQVATLGCNNLPQIAAMSPPQDKIETKLGELDTVVGKLRSIMGLKPGMAEMRYSMGVPTENVQFNGQSLMRPL